MLAEGIQQRRCTRPELAAHRGRLPFDIDDMPALRHHDVSDDQEPDPKSRPAAVSTERDAPTAALPYIRVMQTRRASRIRTIGFLLLLASVLSVVVGGVVIAQGIDLRKTANKPWTSLIPSHDCRRDG